MSESATSASLHDASIASIEAEAVDALPVLAQTPNAVHPYAARAASPDASRAAGARLPDARRPVGATLPAVQAVAVAAGGFVAGAAVLGLVQRRQRRSSALAKGRGTRRGLKRARRAGARDARRAGGGAAELVQILDSRSLLVDVHLLGRPGER